MYVVCECVGCMCVCTYVVCVNVCVGCMCICGVWVRCICVCGVHEYVCGVCM